MDRVSRSPESVFDFQGTLQRLGGDQELLAELISFCLTDSPPLVASLRTAIESRDGVKVRKHAHALKGLVAGCGGVRTANAAQKLERAGESNNLEDALRMFDVLTEELARFRQALNDHNSSATRK
jgi:HPt (histidine-containing phosphotransfer) domain-containing protein